jgi:uncharacterized membrane protein
MSVFGCFLRALAGQALQCMVVAMVFNAWVRLWQEQHQVSCGFAEVILWTVFYLRRFSGIAGRAEVKYDEEAKASDASRPWLR